MKKRTQSLIGVLAMILAIVLFSSMIFLAVEADHVCEDSGCRVCKQIHSYENLLKNIAAAGTGFCMVRIVFTRTAFALPDEDFFRGAMSLVSHKVKLSN